MSKSKFKKQNSTVSDAVTLTHLLRNKYYNYFVNSFKWEGIEDDQVDFIMKNFWSKGTIAAFKIPNTDLVGFAPYVEKKWNMNDAPVVVQLINKWSLPFIPSKDMYVSEDVCLGYLQANKKPLAQFVDSYVARMVDIIQTIQVQLMSAKLPLLYVIDNDDKQAAEDIMSDIESNRLSIFLTSEQAKNIQTLNNGSSNYIIDKLYSHLTNLHMELVSFMGLNTANVDTLLLVDQINANNAEIQNNADGYLEQFKKFCKRIKDTLNYDISVELTHKPAESEHINMGEGVKEDVED